LPAGEIDLEQERLQLAVFIDFDNIEIGVKTTLNAELDLALVLDALRERGEVVSKSAYGDWARAGSHSRTLTDQAVHMVQRNVTPRGDKNGADINLVVDALEMAFTRPHINSFAIVGGDSDFIALVEKLKQFGKRVLVVGGRSFTSGTLQRNCHEFIAYENLLSGGRRSQQQSRAGSGGGRLSLQQGLAKVQRALKILSDRGVQPQLGPLKSTLLQLDPTFSERDYGTSSFREFIQRLHDKHALVLRRVDQGYLVELNGEGVEPDIAPAPTKGEEVQAEEAAVADDGGAPAKETNAVEPSSGGSRSQHEAMALLRAAVDKLSESRGGKPTYVRHLAQALRAIDPGFDEEAFGFRTLTELMHMGQREGLVRMQRDRQGAWRITPMSAASPIGAAEPEGKEPASVEAALAPGDASLEAAAEVGQEVDGPAVAEEALGEPQSAPVEVELAAPEAEPAASTRGRRRTSTAATRKKTTRTSRAKTSSRATKSATKRSSSASST
jgi:uncharacterized protein (TIGR00288 family)